jgi:hypothetical protein
VSVTVLPDPSVGVTTADPGPQLWALAFAALARAAVASEDVTPNVFRRERGHWSITYGGCTVRLRHTKGLADLHRLLASPFVELHVLDLAAEAEGDRFGPRVRQPVLDHQAKVEYRRRILDLETEVDDARACNDPVRLERAEAELERLVGALARGLGLGDRDRCMTDEAERARQAVRARIRYTLDRVADVHPGLHRHLERAVLTGTFCCYRPERDTEWVTA